MHAVLFQGHLLAIAVEQIHIIVIITSVYLEYKQNNEFFHQANQINSAGKTLFIIRPNSWEIINPAQDR